MRGEAIVGVAEVPQVIGEDVDPGHIGPEHVVALLRAVDAPPAGHAEDIDEAGDAVEDIVPSAHEDDALGGHPGGAEGTHGALEIRGNRDEDVDGDDGKGEHLESLAAAEFAPAVLEHHEADAAGGRGVEFGIVEPAAHMQIRGNVAMRMLMATMAKGNTLKASLRPSLPQPYLSIMKPMQPAVAA